MNIQIYLSTSAQNHFGLRPSEIRKDTDLDLSACWWSIWRCEYLISNEDDNEHFFLFTNEATRFSLIIPSEDDDISEFLDTFQETMMHYLCKHGADLPEAPHSVDIELIRGRPNSLIGSMKNQVMHSLYYLCERGLTLMETESILQNTPSSVLDYATPTDAIIKHISASSPHPFSMPLPENILMFPGMAN